MKLCLSLDENGNLNGTAKGDVLPGSVVGYGFGGPVSGYQFTYLIMDVPHSVGELKGKVEVAGNTISYFSDIAISYALDGDFNGTGSFRIGGGKPVECKVAGTVAP